jgi:DNA/RNA-binding domain of Phe-tRNA-synthetase-like protein
VEASGLSGGDADVDLVRGEVDASVRVEFPELGLLAATVQHGSGRSPRAVKARLRDLSDRFRGSHAITMRQDPLPWAYRVFYRHIGLDPDATRPPGEAAAVDRLMHGAFRSQNLLDDALLIALLETGVPIWALDADRVEGPIHIRPAGPDEPLGRGPEAMRLPAGRLVVADERSPVAVLFGEIAPGHGVSPTTGRMTLFALQVAGVPAIHVEEAFWTCVEILRERA